MNALGERLREVLEELGLVRCVELGEDLERLVGRDRVIGGELRRKR